MSTAIRRALYGKMAGDTTLNNLLNTPPPTWGKSIYLHAAPAEANRPFVVFSKQAGRPTEAFQDPSAFENDIWLVKGIAKEGFGGMSPADAVEAIQARLEVLLNDATLSIAGGAQLMYLRRESDVEYAEEVDGVTYRHAGALYRLLWQ